MAVRIGVFITSVSALILFIFAASYMTNEPRYDICLGGIALMALGIFIMIRYRQPSEKAERFRYIRKMRSRKKK